jgi:hypothetical protein
MATAATPPTTPPTIAPTGALDPPLLGSGVAVGELVPVAASAVPELDEELDAVGEPDADGEDEDDLLEDRDDDDDDVVVSGSARRMRVPPELPVVQAKLVKTSLGEAEVDQRYVTQMGAVVWLLWVGKGLWSANGRPYTKRPRNQWEDIPAECVGTERGRDTDGMIT